MNPYSFMTRFKKKSTRAVDTPVDSPDAATRSHIVFNRPQEQMSPSHFSGTNSRFSSVNDWLDENWRAYEASGGGQQRYNQQNPINEYGDPERYYSPEMKKKAEMLRRQGKTLSGNWWNRYL